MRESALVAVAATNVDVTAAIDRPRCKVPAEKVATHDPICVGLIVFARQRAAAGAVLSVDALGLDRETFGGLRIAVAESLSVAPECVVILATHNHSGPLLSGFNRGRLNAALSVAAVALLEEARPAEVAQTRFDLAEPIGFNRRAHLPNYGGFCIMFNDGCRWIDERLEVSGQLLAWIRSHGGDPDAEQIGELAEACLFADGPVDPSVDVIAFRDAEDGRPLATFVRHACHPVIVTVMCGAVFSADFPGVVRRIVSEATGAATLTAAGCCGNIRTRHREHGFDEVERLGSILGRAVVERLTGPAFEPLTRVAFAEHVDAIPFGGHMRYGEAEVARATAEAEAERARFSRSGPAWQARKWDNEYNRRQILGRIFGWKGSSQLTDREWAARALDWPTSAAAFNDIALLGLPGEIFWEIGEQARTAVLDQTGARTAVVCQDVRCDANGYWPTVEQFGTGGYENWCCAGDARAPALIVHAGVAAAGKVIGGS